MMDTPRQFRRMLEMMDAAKAPKHKKGVSKDKSESTKSVRAKRKASADTPDGGTSSTASPASELKIRKGESMAEFSRRVDAAIPLPRARGGGNNRKEVRNSKKMRTKADNLRREYHQRWEARRRKQEEAEASDLEVSDDGEDIWAEVNKKKKPPAFGEVADRPPQLPKVRAIDGVPKSAGSLARREILAAERQRVIEAYRKKRG